MIMLFSFAMLGLVDHPLPPMRLLPLPPSLGPCCWRCLGGSEGAYRREFLPSVEQSPKDQNHPSSLIPWTIIVFSRGAYNPKFSSPKNNFFIIFIDKLFFVTIFIFLCLQRKSLQNMKAGPGHTTRKRKSEEVSRARNTLEHSPESSKRGTRNNRRSDMLIRYVKEFPRSSQGVGSPKIIILINWEPRCLS